MLNVHVIREFGQTNEMPVLPVGFAQHQSGVDRVEVPLYLPTGGLRENQRKKKDYAPWWI